MPHSKVTQLANIEQKLLSATLSPANRLLLTKIRDRLIKLVPIEDQQPIGKIELPPSVTAKATNQFVESDVIDYNTAQLRGIQWALDGKSFIVTGAAGTGKTTSLKGIVAALISSGKCGVIGQTDHKYIKTNTPGIVLISYTNKAVQNVKRRLPHDLHSNCMTAHKFLEFQPEFEESTDTETGDTKRTRQFVPTRTAVTPNPASIKYLVVDEATMLDVPLWNMIVASLPKRSDPDVVLILMGDIQQLPPVFGKSVFIHALQQKMPVVELTEVYRQALENPILALAHRILSGKIIPQPQLKDWNIDKSAEGLGKLTIIPWKKKLSDVACNVFLRNYFPKIIDNGMFDPEEDVVLCPFNVNIGTILINNIIASHTAKKMNAPVYEIYTGTQKVYLRVGERVLHNKSEARVVSIKPNFQYFGKEPRQPSTTMDYEGAEHDRTKVNMVGSTESGTAYTGEDVQDYVDRMLESMGSHVSEDSPAKRAASHIVTVVSDDTGDEVKLSSAGDINQLLLAYSITVHKSQGSEYRRVIFLTTHLHAVMMVREILYVAVTRAKEELIVICEPNAFVKGITSQKIPGRTIQEKIDGFEAALRIEGKRGGGNVEQIPRGLDRFIVEEPEEIETVN